jgi:MFS family permease
MAYFVSGLILIPAWLLIFFTYRRSKHNHFKKHHDLLNTVKKIHKNRDLRGIYMIAMLLYLFYSWMVIYTPIHLIETGFTWEQIGIIFTVMLVPFVVVEYPAGWLADRYLGETEMLTLGFAIMVLSVLALMFVTGYWMVMLVLFLSRVGASLVEIMRDTYFYKKVDEDDIDLVDLFRNTRSIAYVFGPFLASGILTLGYGIPQIFLVLAVLMFVGLLIPFHIEDTL